MACRTVRQRPFNSLKWCSNKMQPSLEMLTKIAETLNVTTKDLIN